MILLLGSTQKAQYCEKASLSLHHWIGIANIYNPTAGVQSPPKTYILTWIAQKKAKLSSQSASRDLDAGHWERSKINSYPLFLQSCSSLLQGWRGPQLSPSDYVGKDRLQNYSHVPFLACFVLLENKSDNQCLRGFCLFV